MTKLISPGIYTAMVLPDGTIQLGSPSNYSKIMPDGTFRLVGKATAYEDLRQDGLTSKPGTTAPTYENGFRGDTNYYVNNFVHTQPDELQFWVQVPHAWVEAGELFPHVHFIPWAALGAGTYAVQFKLEFYKANVNEQFPASPTTYTMTKTWTDEKQWYHYIANNAASLTTAGWTLSALMLCRCYRDNTVANNFAGKVTFGYHDIHFQADGFGSDTEYGKE